MAARSLAARALRTALEALVLGDFIMVVEQAAPGLGGGALGAELCCRAIGATAGRLSAYLFERCGSEAAQLCAHAAHSGGGLGWAQVSRFFVSKASEAAQGGVGGLFICLRWRSAILRESSSLWQVSQTILCEAPATRIDIGSPTGHAQE